MLFLGRSSPSTETLYPGQGIFPHDLPSLSCCRQQECHVSVLPLLRPPVVIKSTKIQSNMYTWYYSRLRGRTTIAQAPIRWPNRYLATLSTALPVRFVIHSSTAASSQYGWVFIEKNYFEVVKNQANCNTLENYHSRSQTKRQGTRSKTQNTMYKMQD